VRVEEEEEEGVCVAVGLKTTTVLLVSEREGVFEGLAPKVSEAVGEALFVELKLVFSGLPPLSVTVTVEEEEIDTVVEAVGLSERLAPVEREAVVEAVGEGVGDTVVEGVVAASEAVARGEGDILGESAVVVLEVGGVEEETPPRL